MSNTTTCTRAQVTTALGTMRGQLNEITHIVPVDELTTLTWQQLTRLGTGPFTYDQVSDSLNNAANALDEAITYENSNTIWAQDVRNLAVSTTLHLLKHPGATLREVIAAQYEHSEVDEVLGWVR